MPFRSKAQRAFLEIHHPEVAKEFAEHTTAKEEHRLPEHVEREAREQAARRARKGPKVVDR